MFIHFRERERERKREEGVGGWQAEGEKGTQRQRGREREGDIDPLPPIYTLKGDWTCNLGMFPNQNHFAGWDNASTN